VSEIYIQFVALGAVMTHFMAYGAHDTGMALIHADADLLAYDSVRTGISSGTAGDRIPGFPQVTPPVVTGNRYTGPI